MAQQLRHMSGQVDVGKGELLVRVACDIQR